MIRRLVAPRSGDAEFDRALALRGVWWIRTARPGGYHMTFRSALMQWWWEKPPGHFYGWLVERYGRWLVVDDNGPLAHLWTARGARKLRDDLNRTDGDRWRIERR